MRAENKTANTGVHGRAQTHETGLQGDHKDNAGRQAIIARFSASRANGDYFRMRGGVICVYGTVASAPKDFTVRIHHQRAHRAAGRHGIAKARRASALSASS